jgi:glucosyl-dolichyl phosphate glucuronosyltransferase
MAGWRRERGGGRLGGSQPGNLPGRMARDKRRQGACRAALPRRWYSVVELLMQGSLTKPHHADLSVTLATGRRHAFSLVICTYNRANHLRDALRTALAQETGGLFTYEVLVVDNNSTDHTRAVVDSFLAEGHHNLRYLFESRQGKSFALNRALSELSGEHYTIVDDDFLLPPRWLLGIRNGLLRHPNAAFVSGKVLPHWSSPPPAWLTENHWSAIAMADYGEREFRASARHRICLLACTFDTAAVKAVGGYDTRLGVSGGRIGGVEDLDILTKLWGVGREGVYLPDVAFEHRVEPERLTKRYHRRWHRGHGRSYAIMRDPETEGTSARLFDVPRYMYRELVTSLWTMVTESLAGRPARAFAAETRCWFIVGFCAERWGARLRRGEASTPVSSG